MAPRFSARPPRKTGEIVGDGTSTSTHSRACNFCGRRAQRRRRRQCNRPQARIGSWRQSARSMRCRSMSRPVKTRKEKAQVGTISAHNDEAVGELVADAMEKVGGDGVITVEESEDDRDHSRSWSRGCSSTAGSFRHTSSPILSVWRPCWKTPTSCCPTSKIGRHEGHASASRAGGKIRSSAARGRRRCGRRGAWRH